MLSANNANCLFYIVMLRVAMLMIVVVLNVAMLMIVIVLNVVMQSVVEPGKGAKQRL